MADDSWALAEAKAKLSEVLDKAAAEGPQQVTRHGKAAGVVISPADYQRLIENQQKKTSFADMFTDPRFRILSDEEHDEIFVKSRDRSTGGPPIKF